MLKFDFAGIIGGIGGTAIVVKVTLAKSIITISTAIITSYVEGGVPIPIIVRIVRRGWSVRVGRQSWLFFIIVVIIAGG